MNFDAKKNTTGWFVHTDISNNDINIATLLEISFIEYKKLLLKYGAEYYDNNGYYFNTQEKVEQFLNSDEILPLITMAILTE